MTGAKDFWLCSQICMVCKQSAVWFVSMPGLSEIEKLSLHYCYVMGNIVGRQTEWFWEISEEYQANDCQIKS